MPATSVQVNRLELVTMLSGATEALLQVSSTQSGVARACYTDGINVGASYRQNAAGTERLSIFTPNGNTFSSNFIGASTATIILDACYDGTSFWYLTATNVFQVLGFKITSPSVKGFAHGVTNPKGICTDGNNLIILA